MPLDGVVLASRISRIYMLRSIWPGRHDFIGDVGPFDCFVIWNTIETADTHCLSDFLNELLPSMFFCFATATPSYPVPLGRDILVSTLLSNCAFSIYLGVPLTLFLSSGTVIIPGAYSSFQLLAAFRRWPGYDFDDMHGSGDFV